MFPFLSNNFQKMGNMRTGSEIVNPCITKIEDRSSTVKGSVPANELG